MAIHHRHATGHGQVVDVALYEAVFAMLESTLSEYGASGFVRERSGASLPGIVPSNTYPCRDGKFVVVGANADSIFKRMMRAIGRPDLADDPGLASNDGRVRRTEELDRVIGAWTSRHDLDTVLEVLDRAEVPAGKIYSIADIAADLHYQARGMIERHRLDGTDDLLLPGIVPRMSDTPGETKWIGPRLGEHTPQVLGEAGFSVDEIAALRSRGVIG
jgi:formyl-CoA transferase